MDRFPYIRTLLQIQLDRLHKKELTIIDIGAYKGDYEVELAENYPKSKVYAIEPDEKCLKELIKNTQHLNNVIVKKLAINTYNGEVTLYCKKKEVASASNTIYKDMQNGSEFFEVKVPCITFDSFCDTELIRDIDLLLLNAEGVEYDMFYHEPSLQKILKSAIIDLSMHGKSIDFNTKDYAQKRVHINDVLFNNGFELVYGERLTQPMAYNYHLRQVWVNGARFLSG